jgi:hypothetical protein
MSSTGTEVPESLQTAVDVLIAEHGTEGAERELRERFGGRGARRELAALAYLRRRYQE